MVFNGYGYFDIAELTWGIGEGGKRLPDPAVSARKARRTGTVDQQTKYGNPRTTEERATRERSEQSFYGLTIVSCERGTIRQSPHGIYVYSDAGREEIPCAADDGRSAELRELHESIVQDRPAFPDGRWGKATLEVCLAILQSSKERREIALAHQIPCTEIPVG
jgi:phthalate 4,5-cis-dihydrodiol dehydrogenase